MLPTPPHWATSRPPGPQRPPPGSRTARRGRGPSGRSRSTGSRRRAAARAAAGARGRRRRTSTRSPKRRQPLARGLDHRRRAVERDDAARAGRRVEQELGDPAGPAAGVEDASRRRRAAGGRGRASPSASSGRRRGRRSRASQSRGSGARRVVSHGPPRATPAGRRVRACRALARPRTASPIPFAGRAGRRAARRTPAIARWNASIDACVAAAATSGRACPARRVERLDHAPGARDRRRSGPGPPRRASCRTTPMIAMKISAESSGWPTREIELLIADAEPGVATGDRAHQRARQRRDDAARSRARTGGRTGRMSVSVDSGGMRSTGRRARASTARSRPGPATSQSRPAAISSGPATRNRRDPIRPASVPIRVERSVSMIPVGSPMSPAPVAV